MKRASPSLELVCRLALLLCLAVLPVMAAETVVLQLKNGDRISGVLISENAERLVLTNQWNKELLVPLAQIEKREKRAPATNTIANAKPVPVALPPTPPVPAAAKPSGVVWHGDFQVGLDLQR